MFALVPFLYQEGVQNPTCAPFSLSMNQKEQQHSYWRSDITGLRALAVLPVLLFHAWPTLLPGGFVGVDIFFVISGYLISGILFRQLQRNGTIDFEDFYAKRVRRIIPNLICVLFFTIFVGWFFLTSDELRSLAKQVYSSAFFYQNFRLLKVLGDYFAEESAQQPLLHLWSLAIEEQFYILFPVLCALVWKLRANVRSLGLTVMLITLGSFLACLLISDQSFRFYFPLTRFWELGVGILLSFAQSFGLWSLDAQSSLKRNVLSFVGISLIALSLLLVREQDFPGVNAIMPTFGAVLILASSPKAYVNRFLSLEPVVFIGLISYSLYLWHWPILSYANIIDPSHSPWINGPLLVLAVLLSVFSYRFIETPFRTVRTPKAKKLSVIGLLSCLVLVSGGGMVIRHEQGVPDRGVPFFQHAEAIREDWIDRTSLFEAEIDGVTVEVNRKDSFPEILFIGDSHMEQYIDRITKVANDRDMTVGFLAEGGCWMAPGMIPEKESCQRLNDAFEELMKDPRLRHVVVTQKWGFYEKEIELSVKDTTGKLHRFDQGGWLMAIQNLRQAFEMRERTLHVILDVPYDESKTNSNYDPLRRLVRYQVGALNEQDFTVPLPEDHTWLRGNEVVKSILGEVATIIDPVKQHCPNDKCNLLNYKDDDHLRASYARDHAVWIDSIFDDVKGVTDESKNS